MDLRALEALVEKAYLHIKTSTEELREKFLQMGGFIHGVEPFLIETV